MIHSYYYLYSFWEIQKNKIENLYTIQTDYN
jgi:hypothetical protein